MSARIIDASERQADAIQLRKSGATYRIIASRCGYSSVSGAYKAVQAGIRKILREPVEELVTLELERLDEMSRALWPAVHRGDPRSIGAMLTLMERRARMLGLDAPKRVRFDVRGEVERMAAESGVDVDALYREVEEMAARPLPQ